MGEPATITHYSTFLTRGELPPIEEPTICYTAKPAGAAASLVGARPGGTLCEPAAAAAEERAAEASSALREVRVPASPAARERQTLTTALGTHALIAKPSDRVLLAAASGSSAVLDPPRGGGALRCATVCHRAKRAGDRGLRTGAPVWVAHALGVEELSVGGASEICLEPTAGR